tara:strand:- start:84 stop:332 length:249 start_codon:yes stop_codon:yes gene_type:complete
MADQKLSTISTQGTPVPYTLEVFKGNQMTKQPLLTDEERAILSQATFKDLRIAIFELIFDPRFWAEMAKAFLKGLTNRKKDN